MMSRLTPVLMVKNIKESIAFYSNIFGFKITIAVPNEDTPDFVIMETGEKDVVEIMLQEKSNMEGEYPLFKDKEIGGTFTLYMDLGDVKVLYDICKKKEVTFVNDLHKTFYGADEFTILDNNNYILVITKR